MDKSWMYIAHRLIKPIYELGVNEFLDFEHSSCVEDNGDDDDDDDNDDNIDATGLEYSENEEPLEDDCSDWE
nr:hypothetical protein [Tanacetum cinerariifolium]